MFKKFMKLASFILLVAMSVIFVSCADAADDDDGYCTVTFDTAGGTPIKSVKVKSGEYLSSILPTPERTDCYFSYWYKDDYKTPYDFKTPVTSSFELNAKWNVKISFIKELKNGTIRLDNGYAKNIKKVDCSEISATYLKKGESETKPLQLTFDEYYSGWDYYSYFKFEPFNTNEKATYTVTVTNGEESASKDFDVKFFDSPENLVASAQDSMVSLSWDEVYSAFRYEVTYYKSSDITSSKIKTVYSNKCDIKGLENGAEYTFKVKAINSSSEEKESEPVKATPKITKKTSDVLMIMYMDGDNNLNDAIYLDMNEVEYGLYQIRKLDGTPESNYKSVNVVALWDGWRGNSTKEPQLKHSGSFIYELGTDSSFNTTYTSSSGCVLSSKTKDLSYTAESGTSNPWLANGEVDMSSKDTLKNFLEWVKARYEATDAILQFSNHGGGPRSYVANTISLENGMTYERPGISGRRSMCWDEGSSGNTFLKTSDVSSVLEDCGYSSSKLSMIIEDVCLGGSIEEAYQLKDYTKYLLASPNNEPGGGLDYITVIKSFTTDATMESVGQSIIAKYKEDYAIKDSVWDTWMSDNSSALASNFGIDTSNPTAQNKFTMSILNSKCSTLTLVDLSKLEAVKNAIDAFANVVITDAKTKEFKGLYYDTVKKLYTITSSSNTRPVTYWEALRELNASYDGNMFSYLGTFTWLYDSGYLFLNANSLSDANLADGSANPNAWADLNTAADSVLTALKSANVYAWRDGFKGNSLYEGANTIFGLTISGGSVEITTSGGKAYPAQEKYPSWYKTELAFGKDCKWGQLLYDWFHEFGESN
ncbi:clostripain-related cysteine peptidase [Treponema pectinovorum]|uniref:clostripain-related cysteine peptidase n=1 Tax=Treponema pectinovorum TaxID=164 RepID=UPI0011F389BE|nr:clostripain-related cysteine peptidase [Treponema pectinovorum]